MPIYTVKDNTTNKTVKFEWNEKQPPTDADMEEVFAQARQSQPPAGQPALPIPEGVFPDIAATSPTAYAALNAAMVPGETLMSAAKNLPSSAYNLLASIGKAVTSPVQTAQALGDVGFGAATKLGEALTGEAASPAFAGQVQSAEAVGEFFKQRYGGLENLQKTIATDPAGFAADAATIFGGAGALAKAGGLGKIGEAATVAARTIDPLAALGKGAAAVAKPVAKAGAKTLEGFMGLATGQGAKTVKTATEGRPGFVPALRGQTPPEDLVSLAKEAYGSLKSERSAAYTQELQALKTANDSLDISPIKTALGNALDKYRIKTVINKDKTTSYDFRHATLSDAEKADVTAIIDKVQGWGRGKGDRTPLALDSLKQQLDNFYSPNAQTRAFVYEMRNSVKDVLNKNVPRYGKMTQDYERATRDLNDIQKALGLNPKAGAETVAKKIMLGLNDNNEFRAKFLEQLDATGTDIVGMAAGLKMNPIMPRGLVGRGTVAGAGGAAVLLGGVNPATLAFLSLMSPRLVGEVANALGKAARTGKKGVAAAEKIPAPLRGLAAKMGAFQAGRTAQIQEQPRDFLGESLRKRMVIP